MKWTKQFWLGCILVFALGLASCSDKNDKKLDQVEVVVEKWEKKRKDHQLDMQDIQQLQQDIIDTKVNPMEMLQNNELNDTQKKRATELGERLTKITSVFNQNP